MNKLIVLLLITSILSSCVSLDNSDVMDDFFSPEIDSVYVEKENDEYRLNVILKSYSDTVNKIHDQKLFIDGKLYKIKRVNDSKFTSENFQPRDNFIDINLTIKTILGKNNPLTYKEVIPLYQNLGYITFKDKPEYLEKAKLSTGTSNKYKDNIIYNNSKAILIGVKSFTKDFDELPYIGLDIEKLSSSLNSMNFSVKVEDKNTKSSEIKESLSDFIKSSGKKDRLIIYISSHGFSDSDLNDKGYIASKDCLTSSPSSTCVPLDYFDYISKLAKQREVQHLLIILDSCASGIGVVDKDISTKPIEDIATFSGIHMLTAGRANQTARMEHDLKMSTFTYFLVKALNGNADLSGGDDYKKDGILTLHELFTYINYMVVERTKGEQIPSLGRIDGEGEIIFRLK